MKKTPKRAVLATSRQRIQAESARPRSVSTEIQTHEPSTIAPATRRLDQNQPLSARPDCRANSTRPGTQVTTESRAKSAIAFPSRYSARENGRDR